MFRTYVLSWHELINFKIIGIPEEANPNGTHTT